MEKPKIRVYLDETRHLSTNQGPMVLGGLWGDEDECISFNNKIKLVKSRHNIPFRQELKWTKVGGFSQLGYYKEIIDTFLETPGINYRGVVIDKKIVKNDLFGQTDDDFYYKMQYLVVRNVASHKNGKYRLFFDYKDTWSKYRASRTAEFLKSTAKLAENDFEAQPLHSDEVSALQVADFLNGLIAYANSDPSSQKSDAKKQLVEYLSSKSQTCLTCDSPSANEKINILIWQPKD